jgi:hypothetical protein
MMELKNHYFSTTILTICRQKSSMNEDSGRWGITEYLQSESIFPQDMYKIMKGQKRNFTMEKLRGYN